MFGNFKRFQANDICFKCGEQGHLASFCKERNETDTASSNSSSPSLDSLTDFNEELHSLFMQGKLKENNQFWRGTIQPSEFVLDIENDYKIPFKHTPLPYKFDNRSFVIKNRSFAEKEIKKLLESGCMEELDVCDL